MSDDIMLVIDLEATCWKQQDPPPGQQQEIIEIGICALNVQTGELSDKRSLLVKPEQSKVSAFCTRLTGITPAMLDDLGMNFTDACNILRREYAGESYPWLSWGQYDLKLFVWQCDNRHVPMPLSTRHLNLKQRFKEIYGLNRAMGMKRSMNYLKLTMEGRHHRGDDDAWNTGLIAARMIEDHTHHCLTVS